MIDANPNWDTADLNECIAVRNMLLTHAASLEIITYERLGSIFLMDKVNHYYTYTKTITNIYTLKARAEQESLKLDAMYQKLVQGDNRIQGWGLSYMNVIIQDKTGIIINKLL